MAKRPSWNHGKTATERGYGWQWQKLRKLILERDRYLCQPCRQDHQRITPAVQVDHIRSKANGGTDDPANLRAICDACHTAKTLADQGKTSRPKRTFAADGWPIE